MDDPPLAWASVIAVHEGAGLKPRELFDLTLGAQDSKQLCLPDWQLGFSPSPLLTDSASRGCCPRMAKWPQALSWLNLKLSPPQIHTSFWVVLLVLHFWTRSQLPDGGGWWKCNLITCRVTLVFCFLIFVFFSQNSLSGKPEHSLEKFQFTDLPNSVPVLSKVKY